jgi:NAD+ kinase
MGARKTAVGKNLAISFVASSAPEAEAACKKLVARYGNVAPEQADVIVALGGDGLMLQTLHRTMTSRATCEIASPRRCHRSFIRC